MDKSADVNTQIDLARQTILIRAYLQDYIKNNPLGDDVLKADYDKIKSQMGDKEYHARHILVEKEAEAKDIIAKLKKGEKFEKLAEKSKDPGSKARVVIWMGRPCQFRTGIQHRHDQIAERPVHNRTREEPVRLPYHQARGLAHHAGATL